MKPIKKKLQDNKGNATYVFGMIFLFLMLAVTVGIIFVTSQYAILMNLKKTSQIALDSYVDVKSVEIYQSVKNSHDYTSSLDSTQYREESQRFLNLNDNMECFADDEHTKLKYKISDIKVEAVQDNILKIRSTYHLHMPVYFYGMEVTQLDSNIVTESDYNFKE